MTTPPPDNDYLHSFPEEQAPSAADIPQPGGIEELVLAGVSDRVRELLRLTSLDTLWALYATRAEALEALGGSD